MHHPPPIRILLDITVRADAPPLPERPIPPRPPLREADEVVALRWLRQTGQYAGLKANLGYAWYMLFVNRLKQPCGRVEMQGSQQHIFELILPSKEAALELLRPAFHGVIAHPNLKFLLAHAGGTLPFLSGRLDSCVEHDHEMCDKLDKPFSHYLKENCYYDSVIYHTPALKSVIDMVGDSKAGEDIKNNANRYTPSGQIKKKYLEAAEGEQTPFIGQNLQAVLANLEKEMFEAAENLEFEEAARIRDEMNKLKTDVG